MFYLRRVVGQSMWPAFKPRQLVLFRKRLSYKPGQVVLIRHAGLEKIKRITQASGDSLRVLGDNPNRSTDSRQFGNLPTGSVIGAAVTLRKQPKNDLSASQIFRSR